MYICFSLSLSLRKFSHFLSIPRHFFILICPNICHWFWFCLRDGFFCEMHAGSPSYSQFHPKDMSSKGRIIQGTNVRGHIGRGHIVSGILAALPAPSKLLVAHSACFYFIQLLLGPSSVFYVVPFRSFFFNPVIDNSMLPYFSSSSVSGFNVKKLQRWKEVLEQSRGVRNRVGIGLPYRYASLHKLANRFLELDYRARRSLRIDSKEPIPIGCVAWRAGVTTTTLFLIRS